MLFFLLFLTQFSQAQELFSSQYSFSGSQGNPALSALADQAFVQSIYSSFEETVQLTLGGSIGHAESILGLSANITRLHHLNQDFGYYQFGGRFMLYEEDSTIVHAGLGFYSGTAEQQENSFLFPSNIMQSSTGFSAGINVFHNQWQFEGGVRFIISPNIAGSNPFQISVSRFAEIGNLLLKFKFIHSDANAIKYTGFTAGGRIKGFQFATSLLLTTYPEPQNGINNAGLNLRGLVGYRFRQMEINLNWSHTGQSRTFAIANDFPGLGNGIEVGISVYLGKRSKTNQSFPF